MGRQRARPSHSPSPVCPCPPWQIGLKTYVNPQPTVPTLSPSQVLEICPPIVQQEFLEAFDLAMQDDDWSSCLEIAGDTFRVSHPSTKLSQLRSQVSENPSYFTWVDPRVDPGWDDLEPNEQWQRLAAFVSHAVTEVTSHVAAWSDHPSAKLGMIASLCREGHKNEAVVVNGSTLFAAMATTLFTTLMCFGTLEAGTGRDGDAYYMINDILQQGPPAIFYALSSTPFLKCVTRELVKCIQEDD